MNIILQDYESVWPDIWPDIWPQNKCRSLWPIFYGPVILPYILKPIWYMNAILWDYESVWPDVRPKIIVCCCDLYFMVQWFCLISWRLFAVWTSYFRIMSQYDPTIDLKINVGHCHLYFMVQWFCLISWRLFDIWTPYFCFMSQYDPILDIKQMYVTVTYISWSIDFALYLENCSVAEHHTLGLWVSMTQRLTSKYL